MDETRAFKAKRRYMPSRTISRREFATIAGAGVASSGRVKSPRTRVAAIQMVAELANFEANLKQAEYHIRQALKAGARWVILPEFFTSGLAFHPDMAKTVQPVDGAPARLLRELAQEGHAYIGGSFLAWRNGNAYNCFLLALPDGTTRPALDYAAAALAPSHVAQQNQIPPPLSEIEIFHAPDLCLKIQSELRGHNIHQPLTHEGAFVTAGRTVGRGRRLVHQTKMRRAAESGHPIGSHQHAACQVRTRAPWVRT